MHPQKKLRWASWSWCPSLPCSCVGVLDCWNLGVGRKRCQRQKQKKNHSTTLAVGHPKRRRFEQVAPRSDHCSRWCAAQHPSSFFAQEAIFFSKQSQVNELVAMLRLLKPATRTKLELLSLSKPGLFKGQQFFHIFRVQFQLTHWCWILPLTYSVKWAHRKSFNWNRGDYSIQPLFNNYYELNNFIPSKQLGKVNSLADSINKSFHSA